MFDDVELQKQFITLNLADLRVGSLVVDNMDRIVQVKSLEATKIEYEEFASCKYPFYFGYINGESSANYRSCPITKGLLKDLEWEMVDCRDKGYVAMYPPINSLFFPDAQDAFPVYFVLRDNAFPGYRRGDKLIKSTGSEDLIDIKDMHTLGGFFYECYKHQMRMNIKEYQTIQTDPEDDLSDFLPTPPFDL